MVATLIEKSATSDKSKTEGKAVIFGEFITEVEGWKIVAAAAGWEGTPYRAVGSGSEKRTGGDCSGTTNKSYDEAGFPYPYKMTSDFAAYVEKSNRFRLIDRTKSPMQAGDILLWPGHMAIYAPFQHNDPRYNTGVVKHGKPMPNNMYTAFNAQRGTPYGPYNIETFRADNFVVYRYLKSSATNGEAK